MTHYHLRMDLSDTVDIKLISSFIERHFEQWCLCLEEGKKTGKRHVHAYLVYVGKLQRQSLVKKLQKSFPTITDRGYSFKQQKGTNLEHLAYVIKEDNIFTYNLPREELDQAKDHNIQVQTEIKQKKPSNMIEKLEQYARGRHEEFISPTIIIDYYLSMKKSFSLNQVANYALYFELQTHLIKPWEKSVRRYPDYIYDKIHDINHPFRR